jgi:hypothetical protein
MNRRVTTKRRGTRRQPQLSIVLMLVLIGSTLGGSIVALAQDHGERAPAPAPTSDDQAPTKDGQAKSEVREERSGEKVKAFQFSGLDIEGQLKSPQMLYFLNRLRAEFGRPRLPHRSFMPELQRSTKGKTF